MTMRTRSVALVAALALLVPGCAALREKDPFQLTVSYDLDQRDQLVVTPTEVTITGRYGFIQVVNNTEVRRNFDIDDLAVFEGVLPGRSKLVLIDEAEDNRSYRFYDHTHPNTISGLVIARFTERDEE